MSNITAISAKLEKNIGLESFLVVVIEFSEVFVAVVVSGATVTVFVAVTSATLAVEVDTVGGVVVVYIIQDNMEAHEQNIPRKRVLFN